MELMVVIKPFRSGSQFFKSGQKVVIDNEQGIIARGYPRHLTKDETMAILGNYVDYTRGVFSEAPKPESSATTKTPEQG